MNNLSMNTIRPQQPRGLKITQLTITTIEEVQDISSVTPDQLPYSLRNELYRCASEYEAFIPGQRRAVRTEVQ